MSEELLLTFVWNGQSKDLVVPIARGTGADIHRAAARLSGRGDVHTLIHERSGDMISTEHALAEVGLLNGDRILIDGERRRSGPRQRATQAHRLHFDDGVRAGETVELTGESVIVGRGVDGTGMLGIADDTVSRSHARLTIGAGSVIVEDLGSKNGTEVNGDPLGGPRRLSTGDSIRFGDSACTIEVAPAPSEQLHLGKGSGRISFNREPRVLDPDPARALELSDPPPTPQRRRFPLPAAVVPVVLGLTMFLVIGNPLFLIMTAMGPTMVIWTTIDDRRSGRRDFVRASAAFRRELEDRRTELGQIQEVRSAWLAERHPPSRTLVERAIRHDRRLWRRRPRDDDFLSVRIGTGTLPSPTSLRLPHSGDADLIAECAALGKEFAVESGVPIEISMIEHPVIGLVRSDDSLSDVGRSMVAQLVTDQSPRDLALAVLAPEHAEDWEFAKWLPHVRALGDETRLIASGDEQARALFGGLQGLAEQRAKDADESIGGGRTRFTPHVVAVFHPPARIPRREVTEFLELASRSGISVLWIASDRTALPGECTAVIDIGADEAVSVTLTDSGRHVECTSSEGLDAGTLSEVARALAPLDDASSGADAKIPTTIDLLELLGQPDISPHDVTEAWRSSPGGLRAIIGADADGVVEIDWRSDGPHALVAGTTGSGKSELLQSLVASMAFLYPPSLVTFVLIDYKGGSAFKDCKLLPHTVGMVTDLNDHLAGRALVSLGAELRYREHLLNDAGAKDIIEMMQKAPTSAPPNLIIIIDEFAALKNEVPDFVDGVIDIAQRGRSLGVHLLLATQQPSGVIDPKIQGNTNIRIALRVADASDSNDVIGRVDAHEISKSLPGRGYLRTGPLDVSEFQSAYVGGRQGVAVDIDAKTFSFGMMDRANLAMGSADATTPTDLQRLVDSVGQAHGANGLSAPRKPWLDALPPSVDYGVLAAAQPPTGLGAVVGLADHPESQAQLPFALDFDEHSNHVVFGTSGAGKSTFLRTALTDMAVRNDANHLWIYVLDYASRGLSAISSLPHCGGVIGSDDLGRTRRLLQMLDAMVSERRRRFGEVSAGDPDEYAQATGSVVPRVVVAIDGFGHLWQTLDGVDRGIHLMTLTSLLAEGRSAGLHFLLTADSRRSLSPPVASSVGGRYMLRMSEPDEYLGFGLRSLATSAPPGNGRAFTPEGLEIQLGALALGGDVGNAAQSEAITALAGHLPRPASPVPTVDLLPDHVDLERLATTDHGVPIGLEESGLTTTAVDLSDNPTFIVFGPDRSGRSTVAATLCDGLFGKVGEAYLLSGRRSPVASHAIWQSGKVAEGLAASEQLGDLLRMRIDSWSETPPGSPVLVMIEDGDDIKDGGLATTLERLVQRARDMNVIVVATMTSFAGAKSYASWVRLLRNNRHGLILQPDLEDDGDLFGVRLPQRAGLDLPPGRGFLVRRSGLDLIQVATGPLI